LHSLMYNIINWEQKLRKRDITNLEHLLKTYKYFWILSQCRRR
jgi:hypothetical protein